MGAKFSWRNDPTKFVGRVEDLTRGKALDLSKKIFDGIVSRTPVRTGSLRASWRVGVNAVDYSREVNSDPNTPLPAPKFNVLKVPLYAKIYITNTTPYVWPIEYGWSSQAPAGMVRITLAQFGVTLNVRI